MDILILASQPARAVPVAQSDTPSPALADDIDFMPPAIARGINLEHAATSLRRPTHLEEQSDRQPARPEPDETGGMPTALSDATCTSLVVAGVCNTLALRSDSGAPRPPTGLAAFSQRALHVLHRKNRLPPDNEQLRDYQRLFPQNIAERLRAIVDAVAAKARNGAAASAAQRGASEFERQRRLIAHLVMGAGKSFSIGMCIALFPHTLSRFPPGCGVELTAARHLIVFPGKANIAELLAEGLSFDEPCDRCAARGRAALDTRCRRCIDHRRSCIEQSALCQRLGLTQNLVKELAEHVYILPSCFDPIRNQQHRERFASAWIVLTTDAKAVLACNQGLFCAADFVAVWMDEGDFGSDMSSQRMERNQTRGATASWDRLQSSLSSSLVFLFSGTVSAWMQALVERTGHLARCTYGDLYRTRDLCEMRVVTLCPYGMRLGGRTLGVGPLTTADRQLLRGSPHAQQFHASALLQTQLEWHEQYSIPFQSLIFIGRETDIETFWRMVQRRADHLRPSTVMRRRLRVAYAFHARGAGEDTRPFRDSDRVLQAFKSLEYDVLIVKRIGKRGYSNPLVKLTLNLVCHNESLASRNEQIQGALRGGRPLRMERLAELAARHGFTDALRNYVLGYRRASRPQQFMIYETAANVYTGNGGDEPSATANLRNYRRWAEEDGAVEAVDCGSSRRLIELVPEADMPQAPDAPSDSLDDLMSVTSVADLGSLSDVDDEDAVARRLEEQRRRAEAEATEAAAAAQSRLVREEARRKMWHGFYAQPVITAHIEDGREGLVVDHGQAPDRRPNYMLLGYRRGAWHELARVRCATQHLLPYDCSVERIKVTCDQGRGRRDPASEVSWLDHDGLRREFNALRSSELGSPLPTPGEELPSYEASPQPSPQPSAAESPLFSPTASPQPSAAEPPPLPSPPAPPQLSPAEPQPLPSPPASPQLSPAEPPPLPSPPALPQLSPAEPPPLPSPPASPQLSPAEPPPLPSPAASPQPFPVEPPQPAPPASPQLSPAEPSQPPFTAPKLLWRLRHQQHTPAAERTYSDVYVPFLHAVLQTGEDTARAAAWAGHGREWAELLEAYRAFLATQPDAAPLLDHVPIGMRLPNWPYIPAAPAEDAPADPTTSAWPLTNSRGVLTQEGVLSQSPVLFARLQEYVLGLQHTDSPMGWAPGSSGIHPALSSGAAQLDAPNGGSAGSNGDEPMLPVPAPLPVPTRALCRQFERVDFVIAEAESGQIRFFPNHDHEEPRGRVSRDILSEMARPDAEMIEWVQRALRRLQPGEYAIRAVVDTIISEGIDAGHPQRDARQDGAPSADRRGRYTSRIRALHRYSHVDFPYLCGPIRFNFVRAGQHAVVVSLAS
jgi:hypothetical protein